MAAPIYSQAEADWMLSMRKRVIFDAWQKKLAGRETEGHTSIEIEATPDDQEIDVQFKIEIRSSDFADGYSVTLKGRMGSKPWEGLCRYDIQENDHENEKPCMAATVFAGILHRHVYNEEACRRLDRWDRCAEVLDLDATGSTEQQRQKLRSAFLNYLDIHFSDSDSANSFLFGETP